MKLTLSDYNSEWPVLFEEEKAFLIDRLGPWLHGTIEHVGSTAVPGLPAKPIIDIMFGVKSLEESQGAIEVLQANGYCYSPYKAELMHWFCKPSPDYRTHHLHLVPYQSSLWQERIRFRELLRADPAVAGEYATLKATLIAADSSDREAYTEGKWPFIQRVLNEAKAG